MNTRNLGIFGLAFFLGMFCFPQISEANDLNVTNVRLGTRDPNAKTLAVFFDLSWKNSWRNKVNHDAAWINVRLQDVSASGVEKRLCSQLVSGLDPVGTSRGTNTGLEIYIPADKTGAFFRRSSNQAVADVVTSNAMLTVNYGACGFSETSEVVATVIAMEMVYVPQGAFFAGDNAASDASFQQGGVDNDPWSISSESAINVTATSANGHYYVSAGNVDEFPSAASFIIPAAFPKGFSGFYMLKYEITEGQWVEFVNSLPADARTRRDVTDATHKNSDAVVFRNTVACSGAPLTCSTERPFRAMTFLSWADVCAFLDWSALRPMTELEFEKSARGPFLPVNGEYAWGNANIVSADTILGVNEDGAEMIGTENANASFNAVFLSGGDSGNGPEYAQGPLRVGIFSTDSSKRSASGAGNYGAMDLSGNVKEWVVTVGNPAGLSYTGVHGDGYLTTRAGYVGNADVVGWPGMDVDLTRGVISSAGAGLRGGSWNDPAARLTISDRAEAAFAATDASSTYGGRGVRSVEGL